MTKLIPKWLSEFPKDFIMKPPYLLSIISGILIGTSYIPFPPWAIFFCFVPLWIYWLEETSLRQILLTGWITQFVLTLIGFNWVSYTVHEFGHLPWPIAIITLFLFCSFASLHIPLAGAVWFFFSRFFKLDRNLKIWSLPIFVSAGERLYPMIFDWHFGYTFLWLKWPIYNVAEVIGFIGLSTFALSLNAVALKAWLEPSRRPKWLGLMALAFIVMNIWGAKLAHDLPPPDQQASFLIVQANIGNQDKLAAEQGSRFREVIKERFFSATERGLDKYSGQLIDFVVWPETAFPEIIQDRDRGFGLSDDLRKFIRLNRINLITGGYSQDAKNRITNSYFSLDREAQWFHPPYHKTVLLAFGEFLPLGETFPWLREQLPQVGNFGRGPGPTVAMSNGIRLGAQICYEGLFDWFTRDLANQEAQILVNLTNDSWYGTWQQPYQHGYMTLARAIEVRRPLVRSTNTGISMVILADGQILEQSPFDIEWHHLYQVPYYTKGPKTIFMGFGYYFLPFLMMAILLFMVLKSHFYRLQ